MEPDKKDSRVNELRSSSRAAMLSCPRKWAWSYGLEIVPEGDPLPLSFGRLWHHGIEIIYKALERLHDQLPMQPERFWDECRDGVRDTAEQWLDLRNVANSKYTEGEDSEGMADLMVDMARRYVFRWVTPDGDQRWTVVSLEGEGQAPLPMENGKPSPIDRYGGRWDGLFCEGPVEDPVRYIMCEQKSTAMKAISRERELAIDPQATGYIWLARECGVLKPGVPIDIVYSISSKKCPKVPHVNKNGMLSKAACETTPEVFAKALEATGQWPPGEGGIPDASTWPDEYTERMDAIEQAQNGLWFHRFTVNVSEADLEAFGREARHDARRLAAWKRYTSIDSFPRNWQACMVPGRSCSYVPLCRSGYRPERDDEQLSEACSLGYRVGR